MTPLTPLTLRILRTVRTPQPPVWAAQVPEEFPSPSPSAFR
jgi:hypothetical protein